MGCICSKEINRSMSIREELSHGFKSSRSAVWEELLTSHSGKDHLLPFLNINNTTFTPTDAWDLIEHINAKAEAEAEAEAEAQTAAHQQPDSFRFTRSKSCHALRDKEILTETSFNLMAGSRSFHTVEEYDELLERIHGTRSLESFEDCFPWDDSKLQSENCSETISRDGGGLNVDEERETGWKRKAVARGLKTLDMSSVEFPGIARMKQRMVVQGQIYSPGTYVTPKFGSYNAPNHNDNDTTFSPELIAAFEDCMQQIQVVQDTILRHMENEVAVP